uniref:DUF3010 family protein n=1 Tax=Flavobacterium sp. TaxID=239 RepID=UPI00404A0915
MKVIGIDFDKKDAVIICLEKSSTGISLVETSIKKIAFKDHADSEEVKRMKDLIFNFFDELKVDKIGIVKRMDSGKYAASPISFKIEGIIQLYSKTKVELIPLPTIKTYNKDNPLDITTKYNYQINALLLSNYLLK